MRKRITILLVSVLLLSTAVFAQKVTKPRAGAAGTWRVIGTTQADFKADHDAIVVAGPFDDFRKVKFKVTDAPLNLMHMVITYDNGVPDKIEVRENIAQGGESRVIDLKGAGKRSIRKIEFWYDTKGILKGKANITVFGMK
jgi:accessory colonization factor AcfC